MSTTFRTHSCGELRLPDVGRRVTIAGWVQKARDMSQFCFVDVRDRYGITQCVFTNPMAGREDHQGQELSAEEQAALECYQTAQNLGREFVVQTTGTVIERSNKNPARSTGDIELQVISIKVLSESKTPPFKIEDETDANEELRMQFRYLDIRRNPMREALQLRSRVAQSIRSFLLDLDFIEVETPALIKSTPEGARDFVVPSRTDPGSFFALPQSPQTFKQLLMVGGIDRYFQIVKCFRDEGTRPDRQPEFTQIDCEMAFVNQETILQLFEKMVRQVFRESINYELAASFPRMTWAQAMEDYGSDKPDIRYGMKLVDVTRAMQSVGTFQAVKDAELAVAIVCPEIGKNWSSKKIKALDTLARSELVKANGLVWIKCLSMEDGKLELPSSVNKFYTPEELHSIVMKADAKEGDLVCIFMGTALDSREAMGKFRHEMGTQLGLRNQGFAALWVVDFPLFEYSQEEHRWTSMHHPFTSPILEDLPLLDSDPGRIRSTGFDMVINGWEVGGGSIRIHDQELQERMFELLGFSKEAAQEQFGFLLDAMHYGAPPHGGLAFGFDRLCALLGGSNSIRDYIAFPKNSRGRDVMIRAPAPLTNEQLEELSIVTVASTSR